MLGSSTAGLKEAEDRFRRKTAPGRPSDQAGEPTSGLAVGRYRSAELSQSSGQSTRPRPRITLTAVRQLAVIDQALSGDLARRAAAADGANEVGYLRYIAFASGVLAATDRLRADRRPVGRDPERTPDDCDALASSLIVSTPT
jgi:hypothetical protein